MARSGGLGALKAKKLFGRPMKLRPDQLKRLCDLVADQTPLQHRFEFALWTIAVVRWRAVWVLPSSSVARHQSQRRNGRSMGSSPSLLSR